MSRLLLTTAILITAALADPSRLEEVTRQLREVAVAAGCAREHVRLEMWWPGEGEPVALRVTCGES